MIIVHDRNGQYFSSALWRSEIILNSLIESNLSGKIEQPKIFSLCRNPTPFYDPLLQNVVWPVVDPNNFVYLDIGNDLILQKDPKEYLAWKRVYDKYVDGPLDVY